MLKAHGHTLTWTWKKGKTKKGSGSLSPESRAAYQAIDIHLHDLRHEGGSRLLEAGWPLEVVLPGHPDKFCDLAADVIVAACYRADPRAYCQVERSVWCERVFLTGGIVTRRPLDQSLGDIVRAVGRSIGYLHPNPLVSDRYVVDDAVCQSREDPRRWTDHVNDQCIAIGWAGYDEKVAWLPPEHFLAHSLAGALWDSCRSGRLRGQGPEGKLLVRTRENSDDWRVEHLLVTIQQRPETMARCSDGMTRTRCQPAVARRFSAAATGSPGSRR